MSKVKNAFHDEILAEARACEERGEPDEPQTYVLCPVCLGEQKGALPCDNCDGTFHVPEPE